MKKLLLKLLAVTFTVCLSLVALSGCDSKWDSSKVTLKTVTPVVSEQGGFIMETQNYVYFINGSAGNSADNTLGTPVKGALFAADKNDLSNTSIVVPKLFLASDVNAGLYFYDGYVYYGTPNTEKNSSGVVAYTEMTFARTKLDGTDTEYYFTINTLSAQYRILKNANNQVCIVYYDQASSSLNVYNTVTKSKTVIAKTYNQNDNESLKDYTFVGNGNLEDTVVLFTAEVFSEDYNSEKAKTSGYTRATYAYNKVYAYKIGDGKVGDFYGKEVLSGNETVAISYEIVKIVNGNVYLSELKNDDSENKTYYRITLTDLYNGGTLKKVDNAEFMSLDASKIFDGDTGYYLYTDQDGNNPLIIKTPLFSEKTELAEKSQDILANTEIIFNGENIESLYYVKDGYIYFKTSEAYFGRVSLNTQDSERKVEIISEGEIIWYAPEILNIGGTDYAFYFDYSSVGLSYVKYVSLDNAPIEKNTDEDRLYFTDQKFISTLNTADKTKVINGYISKVTTTLTDGKLAFDTDKDGKIVLTDEKPTVETVDQLIAVYNLYKNDSGVIKGLTDTNAKLYKKYVDAYEVSLALYEIDGFHKLENSDKDALETKFNTAKTLIEKIFNKDTGKKAYYDSVMDTVVKNLMYEYQTAKAYFEKD